MNRINEIFYSLQGEGFYTGTPAVFVRFAGCNLQCPFCDTDHQVVRLMSDEEIATEVARYDAPLVVLTGGEPALQATAHLVGLLHAQHLRVTMETNGTVLPPAGIDWLTLSPKADSTLAIDAANEVKVVYTGQDVEKFYTSLRADNYFLQPCSGQNIAETINYILEHPHWRLSLQTHKLTGIR